MGITVSLINMKGGVGKTTLCFNLAWYCAWKKNLKVLAVDLDPQANLSQYFLGAPEYLAHISDRSKSSIAGIFEQFSSPTSFSGSPTPLKSDKIIIKLNEWNDGSKLHLIPSRLELALSLRNPTEKSHLLARFISSVQSDYDLILIDCAPTESILTTAAYKASRYIVVPVKPSFLATIGLPLLARSINEHKLVHQDQDLDIAGIIFNGGSRSAPSPEQQASYSDVRGLSAQFNWPVFSNEAYFSQSYQTGSRSADPIFLTDYARKYVVKEFSGVGNEFLTKVGL